MIYIFILLVMLFIVWNIISIGISCDYSSFVDVNNIYKEHGLEPEEKSKIYIMFANICTWYWKIIGCIIIMSILFILSSGIVCGVLQDSKYSDCKICNLWLDCDN